MFSALPAQPKLSPLVKIPSRECFLPQPNPRCSTPNAALPPQNKHGIIASYFMGTDLLLTQSEVPETPELFYPTVFCEHLLIIWYFPFAILVWVVFFLSFFLESFILVTLKHL